MCCSLPWSEITPNQQEGRPCSPSAWHPSSPEHLSHLFGRQHGLWSDTTWVSVSCQSLTSSVTLATDLTSLSPNGPIYEIGTTATSQVV